MKPILDQRPISNVKATAANKPSLHIKNIVLRNGELPVLVPGTTSTDVEFIDATTGAHKRQFPIAITKTTLGEWNKLGDEGRSLRPGEVLCTWTEDNHVFCGTDGDGGQHTDFDALTGAARPPIDSGRSESNQRSLVTVADGNPWAFFGYSGHLPYVQYFRMQPTNGQFGSKSFSLGKVGYYLNYPTFLLSGNSFFAVGPEAGTRDRMNGVHVQKLDFLGTTVTTANQGFRMKPGKAGQRTGWTYVDSTATMNQDSDVSSAIKPFCLTDTHVLLLTQPTFENITTNGGSSVSSSGFGGDFLQQLARQQALLQAGNMKVGAPLQLHVIDKNTGTLTVKAPLDIRESRSNYHWFPQLACIAGPNEYAVAFHPDTTASLAAYDVNAQKVLWTYKYPVFAVTAADVQGQSMNSKMFVAGNQVYVAYVKPTTVPLLPYYIANKEYPLSLFVDRFDLLTGAKTSFTFPLPIKGNTVQLNDAAAVNGVLYVLATVREVTTGLPYKGGAQVLMAIR